MRRGRFDVKEFEKRKRGIGKLEKAKQQLTKSEQQIAEQERQLKQYEKEGYKLQVQDGKYRLIKKVKVQPAKKKELRFLVLYTTKEGKQVSTTVGESQREGVLANIKATGGNVVDVREVSKRVEVGAIPESEVRTIEKQLDIQKAEQVKIEKIEKVLNVLFGTGPKEEKTIQFKELSEKEKEKFITETPVSELKYYEGVSTYLEKITEKQKEQLIEKYLKENKKYEKTEERKQLDYTKGIVKTYGRVPGDIYVPVEETEKQKKERVWEDITLQKEDIAFKTYKEIPKSYRLRESFLSGFSQSVTFPITLPQTVVKYTTGTGKPYEIFKRIETGKTLVLPDVGKKLGEKQIGPSGILQTSIQDVWLTKLGAPRVTEITKKYQRQFPTETAFATAGEVIGLLTGSYGMRVAVKPIVSKTVKVSVKQVPKITKTFSAKFQKAFPTLQKPETYLYGKIPSYRNIKQVIGGEFLEKSYLDRTAKVLVQTETHPVMTLTGKVRSLKSTSYIKLKPASMSKVENILKSKVESFSKDWRLPTGKQVKTTYRKFAGEPIAKTRYDVMQFTKGKYKGLTGEKVIGQPLKRLTSELEYKKVGTTEKTGYSIKIKSQFERQRGRVIVGKKEVKDIIGEKKYFDQIYKYYEKPSKGVVGKKTTTIGKIIGKEAKTTARQRFKAFIESEESQRLVYGIIPEKKFGLPKNVVEINARLMKTTEKLPELVKLKGQLGTGKRVGIKQKYKPYTPLKKIDESIGADFTTTISTSGKGSLLQQIESQFPEIISKNIPLVVPKPKSTGVIGAGVSTGIFSGYLSSLGTIQQQSMELEQLPIQSTKQKVGLETISESKLKFKTDFDKIMQPGKIQTHFVLPVVSFDFDLGQEEIVQQRYQQEQRQMQGVMFKQAQIQKLEKITRFKPPLVPYDLGIISKRKKDEGIQTIEQGYNVFIKDRVYVKGKKKLPEKFLKANKFPLTYDDALSLGGSAVDNSAAATFKIKKTAERPKPLNIRASNWNAIQNKFYMKNDRYIEQTTYRIDKPGEIKGISALGWIAKQKKITPRKRKTTIDPFDIDYLVPDIENQMKKYLGGLNNWQ